MPIFVSLRIQLPFTTRFIIQLLGFLQGYGLYAAGGLIVLFILIKVLLAFRKFHFIVDRLMLSMPFVSKVTINITLSNFTRSLSVLLKSGMTIIDALDIAKDTFHNLYYRREVTRIILSVQKGESIARYLGSVPKLFPPMFTGMVQIGESTGNLEENLNYLSDYYEGEVDETLKNLTTVLEPLLLLVMGLLVGFVALSIITPIYQITQGLNIK